LVELFFCFSPSQVPKKIDASTQTPNWTPIPNQDAFAQVGQVIEQKDVGTQTEANFYDLEPQSPNGKNAK
jgi:hypothetical protein